jgi:hypothetical protein
MGSPRGRKRRRAASRRMSQPTLARATADRTSSAWACSPLRQSMRAERRGPAPSLILQRRWLGDPAYGDSWPKKNGDSWPKKKVTHTTKM